MTIEEKAKAYDEALKKAKDILAYKEVRQEDIEYLFPELAEPEDERIRKVLIDYFNDFHLQTFAGLNPKKILAWLEKQGEQKLADKVEPKIQKLKKGKYYVCIRDLDDNYGTRAFCKGSTYYSTKDETLLPDNSNVPFEIQYCVNDYFRLWTIKDSKDGDVLKEDSCIFIIEKMNPNGTAIVHCCLFDDGDFDLIGSTLSFDVDSTYPATKEQRDLLFQKMKETGYEWDAEKKELKKIEQKPTDRVKLKFKTN